VDTSPLLKYFLTKENAVFIQTSSYLFTLALQTSRDAPQYVQYFIQDRGGWSCNGDPMELQSHKLF